MNIIFHVPKSIDPRAHSGFHVRVPKMIQGFKDAGCSVTVISGTAQERKTQIKRVSNRIKVGERFDFLYAENATIPTLLTETHHLPLHPFLDFFFFALCRKKNIPIGLFYRDIYWRFDEFKKKMSFINRIYTAIFQYIDLLAFKKLVDKVFLPSVRMGRYVPIIPFKRFSPLPPGVVLKELHSTEDKLLRIFYIGGISSFYNLKTLFKVASQLEFVTLTVCCRASDWEKEKNAYLPLINDRIRIVHKTGDATEAFFLNSDIGSVFLEPQEWRDFAMPIKLLEYLQYGLPVIGTSNTAAADFIHEYEVGWAIDYSEGALIELLRFLDKNREELKRKKQHLNTALAKNTWKARAEAVVQELSIH